MTKNTHDTLRDLVRRASCKPGWVFRLLDSDEEGLRLRITVTGPDAREPGEGITVHNFFPVPTATYNEKTWRRWIFEQCRRVENHELGEFFMVGGAGSNNAMRAIQADNSVLKATVTYSPTMASSAIALARLVAQRRGMGDLVEKEVPASITLASATVTKENVADYLPLGFDS